MKRTKPTGWLILFNGTSLAKWITEADNMTIDGDCLVFSGEDMRAEVGSMSWDDYILSAEIMVTPKGKKATYCIQLTGDGTGIYCQLLPHCMLVAYFCGNPKKKPKGFTHLALAEVKVKLNAWHRFQMKAQRGVVTGYLDGREIVSARIPSGTAGMPGLLVNQQKDCIVRVRNIRVKFLNPTRRQLEEFRRDAQINWLRYKEEHRKKSISPA